MLDVLDVLSDVPGLVVRRGSRQPVRSVICGVLGSKYATNNLGINRSRDISLSHLSHIECFVISDSGFVTAPGLSQDCPVRQNSSKGGRRGRPRARDEE